MRVIGMPRSGTNLAKHLLTHHLGVDVVFNRGFWKHGVFPALVEDMQSSHGGVPIIAVSRDPLTQIRAWHRKARNWDVITGAVGPLRLFARRPITLSLSSYGPPVIAYMFPDPLTYWNQFHFPLAKLRATGAPILFVPHEAMVAKPAATLREAAAFLGLAQRPADGEVALPARRLAMTDDNDAAVATTARTFDPADDGLDVTVREMGARLSRKLAERVVPELLIATRRPDYRQRVETVIARQSPVLSALTQALRRR